ncbi:hypothetical protein [Ascidiaceihabitans sp.]|uniref:hypothetical protein n=1 Tax=Ascidiaceihabitans sp. TaxID=1872644 RepID=UPI003298C3A8
MPTSIERVQIKAFGLKEAFLRRHGVVRGSLVDGPMRQGQLAKLLGVSPTSYSECLTQKQDRNSPRAFDVPKTIADGIAEIFGFDVAAPPWRSGTLSSFEEAYQHWHPTAGDKAMAKVNLADIKRAALKAQQLTKESMLGCSPKWGRERLAKKQKTLNTLEALVCLSSLDLSEKEVLLHVAPSIEWAIQMARTGLVSDTMHSETVQCCSLFLIGMTRWAGTFPSLKVEIQSSIEAVSNRLLGCRNDLGWGTLTDNKVLIPQTRSSTSLWATLALMEAGTITHADPNGQRFRGFVNHIISTNFAFRPGSQSSPTILALSILVTEAANRCGVECKHGFITEEIADELISHQARSSCETETYDTSDLDMPIERLPFDHPTPLLVLQSLVQISGKLSIAQRNALLVEVFETVDGFNSGNGSMVPLAGLEQDQKNPFTFPYMYFAELLRTMEETR